MSSSSNKLPIIIAFIFMGLATTLLLAIGAAVWFMASPQSEVTQPENRFAQHLRTEAPQAIEPIAQPPKTPDKPELIGSDENMEDAFKQEQGGAARIPIDEYEKKPSSNLLNRFKDDDIKKIIARSLFSKLTAQNYGEDKLARSYSITHPDRSQEQTVSTQRYIGVGTLSYMISDLEAIYTQTERPDVCIPTYTTDNSWSYFSERCQNYVYNLLAKLKTGKPLYKDLATLDPKGLQALLDLVWIEPSTPLLGTTAKVIYPTVGKGVKDYLVIHKSLKRYGIKKAMKKYNKALRVRGVLSKGAQRDMINVYYDMAEELDFPANAKVEYPHTILGFWLRRHHDGTAKQMLSYFEKMDKAYRQ